MKGVSCSGCETVNGIKGSVGAATAGLKAEVAEELKAEMDGVAGSIEAAMGVIWRKR